MAKVIPDAILDAMLDAAEATHFTVCSAEPANYAGIAAVALTGATAVGAITAAAGDTSGRKNTYAAVTGVSITATGTATHVVYHNNSDTMYFATTCTSQALTSGGTVDVSAVAHELRDPS
jgi:hypothetical protein